MRLKLLLVSLLMISGILHAQDTIKTLVITEAKISEARFNYIEFTNMGATTLNLVDFEFGAISPWNDPYLPGSSEFIMIGDYLKTYLPGKDTLLAPGESFWISVAYDFNREMAVTKPEDFDPIDRIEQWNADIVFHMYEAPSGPTDSISKNHQVMERWNGRDTWYVRYHLSNGDSAVIDQVGGVFDSPEGRNYDKAYDVAGITNATQSHTLVRKFTVKEGNLNFAEARGLDLADSEWIPIPGLKNFSGWIPDRKMFWTVGNHGNYTVNETSVSSSTLDVDLVNKVIDVPWGVHNKDSVMMQLNYHPGLAWHYQLAPVHEDSAFISARTGDTLLIYACGNELDLVKFHINLLPPTDDANWVVPKAALDDEGWFGDWHGPVFDVTEGVPGMDTILDVPFATRIDTIFKYFEKAPEAEWEIVFADGNTERPDVIDGDLLRVTAKSGGVKDYFIDVEKYAPSHNAYLSSITWPDIPSYYKNVYGYIGDTVPNFQFNSYNYKAIVPSDVNGIPSLIAKSTALNTKVEVQRAVNLFGTTADKTVTFTTTAEDDTTIRVYKVVLEKERTSDQVQPWIGEPFVSQFVWQDQWGNGMLEICNPGTAPLDLSNYMVMFQYTNNPVEIITWNSGVDDWMDRYMKYIPGTKWVDSTTWKVTPGIAVQDLSINPIVLPGDVFVLGSIQTRSQSGWYTNDNWWVDKQIDIDFKANPWGEPTNQSWGTQWINASWFMFKILNDDVRNGLKPANDPEDFEVIETWASAENQANWVIGGVDGNADNQTVSWVRKPQYYYGQPELEASWGNTTLIPDEKVQDGSSEWLRYDRHYGILQGHGWPMDILYITEDIGLHTMNEVTEYKSTVSSLAYKVSLGYSMDELINGLVTGVTVSEFLANISKADEGQTLTVLSGGTPLATDAVVTHGDSLKVVSANGDNTSKYFLEVGDGLSSDAVLTSTTYTVEVTGATGTVSGFDYGTALKNVVNGVTLPAGASMDVIDDNGAYVSLKMLNFDTVYVDRQVSDVIYFAVTAEDGVTKITYQLTPNSEASDAFVMSAVYNVDQETNLISLVPKGTTVPSFYKNLTPSAGATMQVKDKAGFDRGSGTLYQDDKLTVTASDGETENTYFLTLLREAVNYLAYALSDVYVVDQNAFSITGAAALDINDRTLVSDFIANLEAAPGATMTVVTSEMTAKDGGEFLAMGDMLEVVAGNAVTVVYYDIAVDPSSVNDAVELNISVYPNPSNNGAFNVTGLETGSRIRVYNVLGSMVLDNVVVNTTEVISLEGKQQGFYFMTISNETGVLGQFKLIVE